MSSIFKTLQSLGIVDNPTFGNLLQVAEPKFQLPHCTFITTKILPEAYSEIWIAVEKQLSTTENHNNGHSTSNVLLVYISLLRTLLFKADVFKHLRFHKTINADSLKDVLSTLFSNWKIKNKVCGGTVWLRCNFTLTSTIL